MGDHILLFGASDARVRTLSAQLTLCALPVRATSDADEAFLAVQDDPPTVLVIRAERDEAVPWCCAVRRFSDVPLVVICAERGERTAVRYLRAGADTVLAPPNSRRTLAARIAAAAARARPGMTRAPRAGSYSVGDVFVDTRAHVATHAGRALSLTPTEFRLLGALASRDGTVATSADLLTEVWGTNGSNTEQLRLYVGYLRQKLEAAGGGTAVLRSHRGVGYSLADGRAKAHPFPAAGARANGHVAATA